MWLGDVYREALDQIEDMIRRLGRCNLDIDRWCDAGGLENLFDYYDERGAGAMAHRHGAGAGTGSLIPFSVRTTLKRSPVR